MEKMNISPDFVGIQESLKETDIDAKSTRKEIAEVGKESGYENTITDLPFEMEEAIESNSEDLQNDVDFTGNEILTQAMSFEDPCSSQEKDENQLTWEEDEKREERTNQNKDYEAESPRDQIEIIAQFYEKAIKTVTHSAVDSVKATLEMGCYLSNAVVESVLSLDEHFLALEEHLKNWKEELDKMDKIYDCHNMSGSELMW
ncbi:uncharacterized protein LOC136028890 isoform X2 [Artemia franciscana]